MSCIAKLQITNLINGEKVTSLLPILQVPDANVTIEQLAEALLKLDKDSRKQIADALREAKVQNLTEDDIKQHRFVSNTSLDGLKEEFPELKQAYPLFKTDETPIIVKAYKINLNGNHYFGRVVDASGQEIFIINGQYGAQKLFRYLDIKNKIKQAIQDDTLREKIKDEMQDITNIASKYDLSIEELLLNYLDDKTQYKPFKTVEGKTIIPYKTLTTVFAKIDNSYDSTLGKSDLELTLKNINKEEKNNFKYKINLTTLYNTLKLQQDNLPNSEDWKDNDKVIAYLKNLFNIDPRLMKAKITITGGKQKIQDYKTLEESEIKNLWSLFKKNHSDIQYETYGQLIKLISTNPNQAINRLSLAFPNSKITIVDNKFEVQNPIYQSKITKISQKELKASYGSNYQKQLKTKPKEVIKAFKLLYPNAQVKLVNNKIEVTYDEAIYQPKEVIVTFPWTTLGEVYDFGYDSQYLFSPVNIDDVKEGKYHGAYIYEYKKGNITHYAISRSIISPNSYAATYSTLEGAKAKIDDWNNTQIIKDNSLYTLKTYKYVPRTSFIEAKYLKEGQLITTLDLKLPHINRLTGIFYDAISGTVPQFKQIFRMIPNINSIETPEQAAAFIYLFYKTLKDINSTKDLNQLILENQNKGQEIVNNILNSPIKSYFIENLNGKEATLKLLKDNGNDIDITGKFRDAEGNLEAANKLSIADMEDAINYFNRKLGISIKTITQSQLNELAEQKKFNPNGVRAFILDGQIYINSSNADISDLFHELSHIFLGVLKINDFNAYQRIIDKYSKTKHFSRTRQYIEKAYQNFAEQDKVEECVADLIAEELTKNQGLADTFKGEEFSQLFSNIFTEFKDILTEKSENGLAFNTMFDAFNRNARLSTFIKDNIKNGKIIEFGCV